MAAEALQPAVGALVGHSLGRIRCTVCWHSGWGRCGAGRQPGGRPPSGTTAFLWPRSDTNTEACDVRATHPSTARRTVRVVSGDGITGVHCRSFVCRVTVALSLVPPHAWRAYTPARAARPDRVSRGFQIRGFSAISPFLTFRLLRFARLNPSSVCIGQCRDVPVPHITCVHK